MLIWKQSSSSWRCSILNIIWPNHFSSLLIANKNIKKKKIAKDWPRIFIAIGLFLCSSLVLCSSLFRGSFISHMHRDSTGLQHTWFYHHLPCLFVFRFKGISNPPPNFTLLIYSNPKSKYKHGIRVVSCAYIFAKLSSWNCLLCSLFVFPLTLFFLK